MLRFNKITLLVLSFFFVSFVGFSEQTTIQGNAFYYRGKTIEIRQYLDLFTFKSSVLEKMEIQSDGSFKFQFNVEKTGLFLVKIGRINAHLFIEPGNQYTLVYDKPEGEESYNLAKDIFIMPDIFESDGKLNKHITDIEKSINQFLIDNSRYYGRGVSQKIIPKADSLVILLNELYSDTKSEYLKTHLHFRLATLELQTNHGKQKVYDKYFKNYSPAYNHISFSTAFGFFFEEYLTFLNPSSAYRFQSIADSAIANTNYDLIYSCMEVDPFLEKRTFRELLIATELYELGAEQKANLNDIISLLDSLIMNAQDDACRLIAANAEQLLTRFSPGALASDFEFADAQGNTYRMSEFKGRYVYIQFFDNFTAETLKEMSLMKILKEGYGTDIAMFSISTKENPARLKSFTKKYDFNWVFGTAQTPGSLLTNYDLRALPAYFYLDKDLKFIKVPSPPPGSRIEVLFAKTWNEEHPNKPLLFKLQPPEVTEEPLLPHDN
mgnify:CR=1 FL=1